MSKPIQICSTIRRFRTLFIVMFVLLCCTFSCKEDPCPQIEPEIRLNAIIDSSGHALSVEIDSLYAINEKKAKVSNFVQLDLSSDRSTYIFLARGRRDTVYFDYEVVVRTGSDDAYCIGLENVRVSSNSLEIVCLDYYHGFERHTNVVNNENLCNRPGLTVQY